MNKKCKWSKIGLATLAVLLVMATAGVLHAAGGEHGHAADSLSPAKLKDLLWRTLNFAALLFILIKFLAKPIANALGARRRGIKEKFEDLEARKAEADSAYRIYEDKLSKIEQEVNKIIENAIAQGEAEKQRIIDEATQAAENIKRQAEMAVQHNLAEAQRLLREEIADQAVIMAEELIKKNMREDDQVKLINDYLEKVGKIQ